MAFEQEPARVPVALGDFSVQIFDPDPTGTEKVTVTYSVQVKANTGEIKVREGDLLPHLSAAQKSTLNAFMDEVRAQASDEMLPGTPP